jgi:hypothetical protein
MFIIRGLVMITSNFARGFTRKTTVPKKRDVRPPQRDFGAARALGSVSLVALAIALAPTSASAQFVCIGNATGANVGNGLAGTSASGAGATAGTFLEKRSMRHFRQCQRDRQCR